MHKIHEKEFTIDDFSCEHLFNVSHDVTSPKINGLECTSTGVLEHVITALNFYRKLYLTTKLKPYWWQMIQLLPSSYNQKRTVMLNYETLTGVYPMLKNHELDEWVEFRKWIEVLPYSEIIIGKAMGIKHDSIL